MKKLILGSRRGPSTALRLIRGIRMGDMAAIHVMVGEWRHHNPNRRLFIIYNPFDSLHEYSSQIPVEWAYGGLADEIWIKERPNETLPPLPGEDLCEFHNGKMKNYVHLWAAWKKMMTVKSFTPTIKPTDKVVGEARAILKRHKVPDKFMVLQALFDAGYHKYRNAPPDWWTAVAEAATRKGVPVVMLGPTQYMDRVKVPTGVFPLFKEARNPFTSLGVVSLAAMHAGGETGFPLWATLFKVPVVALFRGWGHARDGAHLDYRPMSFGAPVVYSPLEDDPKKTAETFAGVFNGTITESTPLV